VNSYEFSAIYRKGRLVITGRVYGDINGCPDLERVESGFADVLAFRLIFREAVQVQTRAFSFTHPNPPPLLRSIRILLPDYQEFVLLARQAAGPYHPVTRAVR